MTDQELAMRVHDAYDSLAPSQDVQDRVLLSLRAAQAGISEREARDVSLGQGSRVSRARRAWLAALPLAACLVAAAVVLCFQPQAAPDSAAAPQEVASQEAVREDGVAGESAAVEPLASNAGEMDFAVEEEYENKVPVEVNLPDGATFEVGDALPNEPEATAMEEGEAWDGSQMRPCKVADRAYVRLEGDDTWYELVP